MPKGVAYILIIMVVLSWIPLALIARARALRSAKPRVHVFQGMDDQPKYKGQAHNPLFADRRSMRPQVPGTVARGQLRDDDHYYQGKVSVDGKEQWAQKFPKQVKVTESLIRRGQERFNIYCAPCHGLAGDGDGPVAARADKLDAGKWGWVPPVPLHSSTVLERPVGSLFNTITHGVRSMPAYGPQIAVDDRWAIVTYIRALQYSRQADISDVPADRRDELR